MGTNLPGRRRPAVARERVQRSDGGEARLWHLGTALAVSFTVAVVGLAGLAWLAWALLGLAGYRRHGAPALKDTVSVLQLVFATVAGAGALVALIVAYRRQKIAEADSVHDRTRVFNERFTAIATQLGDAQPAVRLAGVHAMAGLADDWKQNRQTCVDVLCAYLRLPYDPDPGDDAAPAERTAYRANREVRHTIIRLIGAHLRPGAAVSWQGLNFDFTGVIFDGGDFRGAEFSSGLAVFDGAEFSGGTVRFNRAKFSGGRGLLRRRQVLRRRDHASSAAEFSGGTVSFRDTSSLTARFASTVPSFPAAPSTSTAPSSPAARSVSTPPSSLAGRSASAERCSLAARSASPGLRTGHIRRYSAGRASHRRGWCYRFSRPRNGRASSSEADERRDPRRTARNCDRAPAQLRRMAIAPRPGTAAEHSASHFMTVGIRLFHDSRHPQRPPRAFARSPLATERNSPMGRPGHTGPIRTYAGAEARGSDLGGSGSMADVLCHRI